MKLLQLPGFGVKIDRRAGFRGVGRGVSWSAFLSLVTVSGVPEIFLLCCRVF